VISAACVTHLGYCGARGGLKQRAQRRGRFGTVAHRRCASSGRRGRFGSMTSSTIRPGERGGAHRGLEAGLDAAGVILDDGQAAEAVGVRGEGYCRGSPGSWSLRIDAWRSCEGSTGVREVRGSPVVKNCEGGAEYRRRSSARFRHGQGSGSRVEDSGSFLTGRRSCREPWPGLGCTRAAGPRRSRGAARRSKRAVVLGRRWRL
jgi:hypothetical protein